MHSLITSGAEQIPEDREHRHVSEGWRLGCSQEFLMVCLGKGNKNLKAG